MVADFDGQRKRTSTKYRDLNPVWNEPLEFVVCDPDNMEFEELEIEVLNDKRYGNASGSGRKNHFLGRLKLYGSQFSKRGEEGLVYFPLEKKSVFSWIRGEIGLRIYYYDEVEEALQPPLDDVPPEKPKSPRVVVVEEGRVCEVPRMVEAACPDVTHFPPVVVIEESPPPVVHLQSEPPAQEMMGPPQETMSQFPPEVRKMETRRVPGCQRIRVFKRPYILQKKKNSFNVFNFCQINMEKLCCKCEKKNVFLIEVKSYDLLTLI